MAYERRDIIAAAARVSGLASNPEGIGFITVTGFTAIEKLTTGVYELTLPNLDLDKVWVTIAILDTKPIINAVQMFSADKIRVRTQLVTPFINQAVDVPHFDIIVMKSSV